MERDAALEKLGGWLVGEATADNEWRMYCPLHEEPGRSNSPSASLNIEDDIWYCQSCGHGGTIRRLMRAIRNNQTIQPPKRERPTPTEGNPDKQLPTSSELRHWQRRLEASEPLMRYLTDKRGLSPDTIREWQIGYDGSRYTIPVFDLKGELVNVRRYKSRARSGEKMISWGVGYGSRRLFNPEDLAEHDEILFVEGEWDCIISRQYNLPAFTHTGGVKNFKLEWAPMFAGKVVYLCFDDDPEGAAGAVKVAAMLKDHAKAIYRIDLDTGIKSGDMTDYFVTLGGDEEGMRLKMKEATLLWEVSEDRKAPKSGLPVSVEESQNVEYGGQPLELTAMVIGKQTPAFIAPKRFNGICGMSAGPACNVCPIAVLGGKVEKEVPGDDERLLQFVNQTDRRRKELYAEIAGAKCTKHIEFLTDEAWNIEELVVTPSVDHRTEDAETPINRKVYNVGTYKTPINQAAKIVGRQVPDPASQRGTFMSWHVEPIAEDLDEIRPDADLVERLRKFRPDSGQSPYDKCIEISRDLAANVTHIYGRDIMHVAMDLVWHSVTTFSFDEKPIRKGWLEALVLGDTRTGKSEAATALRKHYGAGVIKSCEGASFAGLVGGAQQVPGSKNGWMITWGTLPLNDRRLVVLDEMSGLMANKESHILGDMSSIRSEGRATITKIVTEETSARTRILWISNPNTGEQLGIAEGSALEALQLLVRNPEDIARFDFAMAIASDEVPSSVINSSEHTSVAHRYGSDDCHALVMWAWSRRAEDVVWAPGATMAILGAAEELGRRYIPTPPLIQVENVRVKVARLAVAFAARTFSTDGTGTQLIVRKSHVSAALRFLAEIYRSNAMGYEQHSARILARHANAEKHEKHARELINKTPGMHTALVAVGSRMFRVRDLEEASAMDRGEGNLVIRSFLEWGMVTSHVGGRFKMGRTLSNIVREMSE